MKHPLVDDTIVIRSYKRSGRLCGRIKAGERVQGCGAFVEGRARARLRDGPTRYGAMMLFCYRRDTTAVAAAYTLRYDLNRHVRTGTPRRRRAAANACGLSNLVGKSDGDDVTHIRHDDDGGGGCGWPLTSPRGAATSVVLFVCRLLRIVVTVFGRRVFYVPPPPPRSVTRTTIKRFEARVRYDVIAVASISCIFLID